MDDLIRKLFQNSVQLNRESDERQGAWLRHVLTLAAGTLAILAGLELAVPAEGFAKNFLAATWGLLGLGIMSGAAATYMAVDHAKRAAECYRVGRVRSIAHGI